MSTITKVLAFGETKHSGILKTVTEIAAKLAITVDVFDITSLPYYDGQRSVAKNGAETLKSKLDEADAVLFSVSDSHHLVSATLKNAVDWAAHSGAIQGKPGAIFGVGDGTISNHKAQQTFRQIAATLGVNLLTQPEVNINIDDKTSFDDATGKITDDKLKERLDKLLNALSTFSTKLRAPLPQHRRIKVLGISGSLRAASANTGLLRAASELLPDKIDFEIADISKIPLYDGDVENAGVPLAVQDFIEKVTSADALVFATPEYNFGIAGPVKNAYDWASRKQAFVGKPAILVSSGGGLGGALSQYHFRQAAVYPGLQILPTSAEGSVFAQTWGGDIEFSTGNVANPAIKNKLEHALQALYEFTLRQNNPISVQKAESSGTIPELVLPEADKKTPVWNEGKFRILAVSGSLRSSSFNTALLREAQNSAPDGVEIQLADPLRLPLFNEDVEKLGVPQSVQNFVDHVKSADAILFSSPEYNYSYSPILKNAIDWASRQKAFDDKPASLIGAGAAVGSSHGQTHLRQVSVFLNAHLITSASVTAAAFAPGNFDFGTGSVLSDDIKKSVQESVKALVTFAKKIKAVPQAKPVKVVAIQGTIAEDTLTQGILNAAKSNTPAGVEFEVADVSKLPRYDTAESQTSNSYLPEPVAAFTRQLREADAFLFVSPEYNNSISAVLKNAIDWGISSKAFEGKAASSIGYGNNASGTLGLYHLRQVTAAGAVNFLNGPAVQINLNDPKVQNASVEDIIDADTNDRIAKQLKSLQNWALRVQ